MNCIDCGTKKSRCVDTRAFNMIDADGEKVCGTRRTYECRECDIRFSTDETYSGIVASRVGRGAHLKATTKHARSDIARQALKGKYATMTDEQKIEIGKRLQAGREKKRQYTAIGKVALQENAARARAAKVSPPDDVAKGVEAFLKYSERLKERAA